MSAFQTTLAETEAGEAPGRVRAAWRMTEAGFVRWTLAICLIGQRFALPAGGSLEISVATPLVFGLALWGLNCGCLTIDRKRAALMLGLCACALVSVLTAVNIPLAMAPRMTVTSLLYWLFITAFAVLRFRRPMPEETFFRSVNLWLAVVAAAGLIAFVAQFGGISVFSFTGYVPGNLLIEDQYAVVIPLAEGSLLKANGFFLVEPSVFSQFMAVGIIVEGLYFRRPSRIVLFFAALLASASGTGWMILGAFILQTGISSGGKGLLTAAAMVGALAIMLVVGSLVTPEIVGSLMSRMNEFGEPGSSAYERFVTPFMAFSAVLADAPYTFFTGVGPGGAEELTVPFFYRLNTPVKIMMEYGVFGFLLYLALILSGRRTPRQQSLLFPLLVFLLFTGGYHQFSPILFSVLLIGTVATLEKAPRRAH